MLASFVLLALAAATANAHPVMQQIIVDGKAQGALTGIRVPKTNGPVTDVTSNDVICNANVRTPLPTDVINVQGGSKIGLEWHRTIGKLSSDVISASHRGPIQVYMAKVDSATQADVTGLKWFKVAEQGFDPATNTWAVDDLIKNKGVFDFTVPSCIEAGDYIMRTDLTALHDATKSGAQLYMGCGQLKVSGTDGSATPSTVSFPGAYSKDDPGFNVNIFKKLTSYTIPGPQTFSCDGSSQDNNSGSNTGDNAGSTTTTSAADSTSTSDSATTTKTKTKKTKTKTETETATVTASAAAKFVKRDSGCRKKRGHA